ncbi:ubiquitin thioesterase otubain-like [Musa troglodytarum]|uniref:ubiquitinyl hydrolase 1 n=1 Tax=Musa troglodytarum TaxID=320322 RepID=A0A9E7G564_9LILI|nr:ubiquitin thioesterase otubain-like [Musa troglodytarum]
MFSDYQLVRRLYASFRPIRNDGASLYRSFLFAYVEHIWITRDNTEVDRIRKSLTVCQWTNDIRGNICANCEELREMFLQLLYEHIREESRPRSQKEFLSRSLRQWDSASSGTLCSPLNFLCLLRSVFSNVFAWSVISLLGYAASNEIARQAAEILFDPDIDYDEVGSFNWPSCVLALKIHVLLQVHSILGDGETIPYHRQLAALSDALGVAVRVVILDTRLDQLGRPSPFHRDFSPTTQWKIPRWSRKPFPPDSISLDEVRYTLQAARRVSTSSSSSHRLPFITLLYRPGGAAEADHYDILYPKLSTIPEAR